MIKLDIGSAGCPKSKDYIHIDITKESPYTEEELGFKPVDIVADAHYLPIRSEVADEVWSGRCVCMFTGTQALREAFRVLKENKYLKITVTLEDLPATVRYILRFGYRILNLEVTNMITEDYDFEEAGVYDVQIIAQKYRSERDVVFELPKIERS